MIAPARAAAFEILLQVSYTDAHSDELLRSAAIDRLSAQDRALVTTLVLGTLRWQIKLDALIRPLLARPGVTLAPVVETALRLGAYQLLYLDRIPAHAAIGESVELVKRAGERFASGMVNAVLRKLAKVTLPEARTPGSPPQLAETYAHPLWMVERWASAYGLHAAESICRFDQEPSGISLRLLHPEAETSLREEGVELVAGEFLVDARRVVCGDVVRSRAFREGWVRIQDEGSQMVAELAGHGMRILDVCAAPGGKAAILAERNPEALVTAQDASRRRLEAMQRWMLRGGKVEFAVQDATVMQLRPEYDLILCDVPCTGTGTMGRNPEIRSRVSAGEIARQRMRQVKILRASLAGLATGGRLLYATCSLEPEENEAVIAECTASLPGFYVTPLNDETARLESEGIVHRDGVARLREHAVRDGFLRTIPGIVACDGFFAALIRRDSE